MRDKIENKKIQRIILILFVLLAICASFLLIAEQTRAPEGAWKNEVYAIRPSVSTFPNVKLDNIQGNTNLSNPVRQEAKDTQTETPKSERAEAGKVPRDGTKEDTDEQGKDTDGPEFEQKFEDLPEDALVQTSLQVSDLMKEIGLSDSKQILYVRNITGVGSDTILQSVNGSYALLLRTIGIADGSLECGTFLREDEFAAMRRVRRLDPEGQGGGNTIWTPPAAVISVAEPIDFSCQPAQGKI